MDISVDWFGSSNITIPPFGYCCAGQCFAHRHCGRIVVVFHLTTEGRAPFQALAHPSRSYGANSCILTVPCIMIRWIRWIICVGVWTRRFFQTSRAKVFLTLPHAVHEHHGFLDWRLTAKAILLPHFLLVPVAGQGAKVRRCYWVRRLPIVGSANSPAQ